MESESCPLIQVVNGQRLQYLRQILPNLWIGVRTLNDAELVKICLI